MLIGVRLSLLHTAALADIPLSHRPDLLTKISVPDLPPRTSDTIPLSGWKLVSTNGVYRTWETEIPLRMRKLFYHRPPDGMTLTKTDEETLPFVQEQLIQSEKEGWSLSKNSIRVTLHRDKGFPSDEAFLLTYTIAVTRENNLRVISKKEDIFRDMILRGETRHGLYAPAPTTLEFELSIPRNAVFTTQSLLLPPEVQFPGEESDGGAFRLQVQKNGAVLFEESHHVSQNDYTPIRIDLSQFAEQNVKLIIQTLPNDNHQLDYIFLADPIVYTPKKNPQRIVVLFIDTLRQDALSLYGNPLPTSPQIDQWAKAATVYNQAYSVSPWTLPAARSMLIGAQPEQWDTTQTLQQALSQKGWNTAFFAGNVYLSSTFGFAKDWGRHYCENWPLAELQIQRANTFFGENSDRDTFLFLHLMDMHMPYTEPLSYRTLFAPQLPSALPKEQFTRKELLRRLHLAPDDIKKYVRGRYDNNLRYIDDTVAPFLDTLAPTDTVVILSDHGEEFWEHNGFEHGHTLYEELIRIPFIIKTPDLASGTKTSPISVIDLAPTIASIANVPFSSEGKNLLTTLDSDFHERPIIFGRPLYGDDGWGTLSQGYKYTTRSAKEHLFYLPQDQEERVSILERVPEKHTQAKENLSKGLETTVQEVLRLKLSQNFTNHDAHARIRLPQGIKQVWSGDTTIGSREIHIKQLSDTEIIVTWPARQRHCVEVFIIPHETFTHPKMKVDFKRNDQQYSAQFEGDENRLLQIQLPKSTLSIRKAIMPVSTSKEREEYNSDVEEALKALGYQE